jgi:hypothetical protein
VCQSMAVLTSMTCNDAGVCVTTMGPCPAGQICRGKGCEAGPTGGPGDACRPMAPCRPGLTCIKGTCCADSSCMGECSTGACTADGSGCEPRRAGAMCGGPPTCADENTVAEHACDGQGACAPSFRNCPGKQGCADGECMLPGPADCAGCDKMCQIVDILGVCVPAPDGTPCRGASGMTCQKCQCGK